jgi:hypothetical protein
MQVGLARHVADFPELEGVLRWDRRGGGGEGFTPVSLHGRSPILDRVHTGGAGSPGMGGLEYSSPYATAGRKR